MFDIDNLRLMVIISLAISSITCAFIQKTKNIFKSSKYIVFYSFIVNMVISILFCITFTKVDIVGSLWIGLFSFIGADSLYKSLEGRISSYNDLISTKVISLSKDNIINKEDM